MIELNKKDLKQELNKLIFSFYQLRHLILKVK